MKRIERSFILLIILLFMYGCALRKETRKISPTKLTGVTLSKRVNTKGSLGLPIEPTSTFSTQDTEVIALVKVDNLVGDHTLRWEWFNPEGHLYYSTSNFPFRASKGMYLPESTAWHRLSIKDDQAENYPGQWEVKVFFDNKPIESRRFFLNAVEDVVQLPSDLSLKPYPKDWGLIIGIENYAHLPNVDFARKDALIVKDYFIKALGVPEENIIFLINGDATKARMEGYLKQYLPDNVNKDTTLYVYFAGHGAPDMEKGEPYLVPHDGDTKFIGQTGYKLKAFYQDLDNLHIKRVYVFLDSCFSGVASRAAEMLVKGTRPVLIHMEQVHLQQDKIISLAASGSGQISNSYPEKQHGLFTYFLLRAIKGEADKDDDHWVSVKEVFDYVNNQVVRVSRRMGVEQNPVITPPLEAIKDIAINRVVGK